MDFDIDWNLDDARRVTKEAHTAVVEDPTNKKKIKTLTKEGIMFTTSLRVLNEDCMEQVSAYRNALKSHKSQKEQEQILDELYESYQENMSKRVISNAFSSPPNLLRLIFE